MIEIPEGVRLHPRGDISASVLTFYRFRSREPQELIISDQRLILILNLQGKFKVSRQKLEVCIQSGQGALVASPEEPVKICFERGNHQLITLQVDRSRLKTLLETHNQSLPDMVEAWLEQDYAAIGPVFTGKLSRFDLENAERLIYPPVAPTCLDLWYQGKIIELLCAMVFSMGKTETLQWIAGTGPDDRIQRASSLLRKKFAEPVSLEILAREVGCSPTYLSRQFKQQTGKTILAYVREIRIREAAEYLKRGTHNVTEAAYDVGYASLGQFSNAFSRVMGISPQKFLMQNRKRQQEGLEL